MKLHVAIIIMTLCGSLGCATAEESLALKAASNAAICLGVQSQQCSEFRFSMHYLANFPNAATAAVGLAYVSQYNSADRVIHMSMEERERDFALRYLAFFPNPAQSALGKAYIAQFDAQ